MAFLNLGMDGLLMSNGSLGQMLSAYTDRKQVEREQQEQRQATEDQIRDRGRRILSGIVTPVLHEVARELRASGHQADVRESLDCSSFSVAIAFTPNINKPDLLESELKIQRMVGGESVLVQSRIRSIASDRSYESSLDLSLQEISESLVREQAIGFVGKVLDVN